MDLVEKDKTFLLEWISTSCKGALENEKFPQFAMPEHIRRNIRQIVTRLSKLEERLVSIRITFAQIR